MGHNEPPIGVMQIGKNVPETGSDAWLAGYPFGSPALLIRKTAVAGAGILFGPTGLAVVVPAYLVKELQTRLHQH